MPRSARLTRKVERLVALAQALARGAPGRTRECCDELLDVQPGSSDFLSDASCLNNDGVPLQLCLTAGARGSHLRVIGDPGAVLEPGEARHRASTETLLRALNGHGLSELVPVAYETVALLLPSDAEALRRYTNGLIWIAASPDGPGAAFYVELAPLETGDAWVTVARWLDAILPDATAARQTIATLSRHCVVASAGLEGTSAADARAKFYFRLREPMNLHLLQLELLASDAVRDFLGMAMGTWGVDLQGLVLSAGFSLATGAHVDVKVDLCGHCLRHSLPKWASIADAMTERFGLAPLDLRSVAPRTDVEVAFVGLGLTTDRQARLNLYLKHAQPDGPCSTQEIDDALTDACRYFGSTQSASGSWTDFQLPVGASDQWVTGYVGFALARAGGLPGHTEAAAAAGRAADWLSRDRSYDAGWGFNGITGPDSDSTAMAIALLDELQRPVHDADRNFLGDHWRHDSGIATYDGPDAWGEGHWDVTPWGFHGMRPDARAVHRGQFLRALERNLAAGGFWRSYWWRNPYYSTFVTLEVIERLGIPDRALPGPAAPAAIDNAFDLACDIGILLLRHPADPRLETSVRTLLQWQDRHGAWSGSANLRVTENDCHAPWDDPRGAYYTDHRSTITTATAIRVLSLVLDRRYQAQAGVPAAQSAVDPAAVRGDPAPSAFVAAAGRTQSTAAFHNRHA